MRQIKRALHYVKSDFGIMILDVVAVNVAYFLALFLRFFAENSFKGNGESYIRMYGQMAPFYTVLCLLVFAWFRLYGGSWRYAGLNDLNRVICANLVTILIQVLGSIIFIRFMPAEGRIAGRMPISFYFIGALLQFIFILMIRFCGRLLRVEKTKIVNRKAETIPAMVIGSGELARKVYHHLDNNTPYRILTLAGQDSGRMMDGIPIVSMEDISAQIKEKHIKAIFIADKDLNREQRERIRAAAEGLEMEDFTGYMVNQEGFLPLTNLLDVTDMPITVETNGQTRTFSSPEECLAALAGEYDVLRVQATKLTLKKREEDKSWMDEYRNQTGEDVSFF